jgi:ketosteroid isomerase-like protein
MAPAELAAREAIRDLTARYNALGDADRLEALCALFAEEGVLELDGRVCEGRREIRALFESAAEEARGGGGIRLLRHFTSTHVIDLGEEGRARGRLYYHVLTDRGLDHWGRYLDEYRVDGDRWRFARRRVTVDGLVPGGFAERTQRRLALGR